MVIRRYLAVLPFLFAAMAVPAVAGDVYKWKDAQGRTHFSSTPPPGQAGEKLHTPADTSSSSSGAPAARSWQEQLDLSNQRRQQTQERTDADIKAQQDNQRRCVSARSTLDSLERGGARYRINSAGEREYLDDPQRQSLIEVARQRVALYCQ